jgi:predicted transcriptional regulator
MDGVAMTVRLSDDEADALRKAAEAAGMSMQEYARAAIREKTSSWAAEREAFLTRFVAENKQLLDRLAQ